MNRANVIGVTIARMKRREQFGAKLIAAWLQLDDFNYDWLVREE